MTVLVLCVVFAHRSTCLAVCMSSPLSDYPLDGPNLILYTGRRYNIARFFRPPLYRKDKCGEANAKFDVRYDQEQYIFYVAIHAVEPIKKGEEVFVSHFIGDHRKQVHHNMVLAARVSHWYHRWCTALEQVLHNHGVHWKEDQFSKKRKARKFKCTQTIYAESNACKFW